MTRLISTLIVLTAVMLTGLAQATAHSGASRPDLLPATVPPAAGPADAKPAPSPAVQVAAGGWEWRVGGDLRDIQFFDADNGWIVGNVGPLHTTDGGAMWNALTGFSAFVLNDLQFTDAQNGWAVGSSGSILHTGDAGVTWTPQASGVTVNLTRVSFVDNLWGWVRGEGNTLRRTTDGGQTWAPVSLTLQGQSGQELALRDVYFVDRNTGWLNAGTYSETYVYRSTDGGTTWTSSQPSSILCENSDIDRSLFFLDAQHGWVMCQQWDGPNGDMYGFTSRTTDGGMTWTQTDTAWTGGTPKAILFVSSAVGWMGGTEGIWGTSDGGASWVLRSAAPAAGLHFLDHDRGWAAGRGGAVQRTTDGGSTWQVVRPETADMALTGVQFIDRNTGFATGQGRYWSDWWCGSNDAYLFRTTDAGATWSRTQYTYGSALPNACGETRLDALAFRDANAGIMVGTQETRDYLTYERYFTSWTGFAATTEDGGGAWSTNPTPGTVSSGLAMIDSRTGWLAGETPCDPHGTLALTTDGGATWTSRFDPPEPLHGIAFADPRRGWTVGSGGAIYHTADWGASWEKQTSPTSATLNDVFFLDAQTGWAVGDGGTILSTTDGAEWQLRSSGTGASLTAVDFLDAHRGWAAGSGGTILYTTDGGAHWIPTERFTGAGITGLAMISQTDGWAVGASGILLHFTGLPPERTVTAPQASTRPRIDGDLVEWQPLGSMPLDRQNATAIEGAERSPTFADLSATVRGAWAPEALYFAATIADDVLVGHNSPQIWGDDVIELAIRVPQTGRTHQFTLAVDGRTTDNGNPISALTFVTRTIAGGWALEVAIPATALGLAQLTADQAYPFTFGLWDDDLRTYPGQTHLIWQGTSTTTYQPGWGSLTLSGVTYDFLQPQPPTPIPPTPIPQVRPGDPDLTFGTQGRAIVEQGWVRDVVLQPDGKIVAAGEADRRDCTGMITYLVARLKPDGSPDFATVGDYSPMGDMIALDVALQPDDRILTSITFDFDDGVWLLRLTAEGRIDPSFADPDRPGVWLDWPGYATDVAVQPDGKILVAGASSYSRSFLVGRINPDGSADTTFGGKGYVVTDFGGGPPSNSANALAIQPDGKILAAGTLRSDFALVRYNPDGSLDPTFGDGGLATAGPEQGQGTANALALQPDGKIVAVGSRSPGGSFALLRFNPDGRLDAGFGTDGRVFSDAFGAGEGVALQPDGKIVVAGSPTLARFRPDGSLDPTFGTNGSVNAFGATGVAIQPDGKIVVAGGFVARFHGDWQTSDILLARRVGALPVVDGDIGEWAALNAASLNKDSASRIIGAPPGPADLGGRLHVAWTSDQFYFAAAVTDDVLVGDLHVGDDSADPRDDDALELALYDARTPSVTHRLVLAFDGRATLDGQPVPGVSAAARAVSGGWQVEADVPADLLGFGPLAPDRELGFTWALHDDDLGGGSPAQTRLIWRGQSTETYDAGWGTLRLDGRVYDFVQPASTPTPTPFPRATPTPTATATPTPTPTRTATATSTPSQTPIPTTGHIAGTVWLDTNGSAAQDSDEPGLSDVTVRLFRDGRQIGQARTNDDGAFRFEDLPPGAYLVREIQPNWLRWSTTPDEATVALAAGETRTVDFGDWNGRRTYLPLILR